ncbi:hypothetical protein RB594_009524 [Gaeumannomyces avenae]
MSPLLAWGIYSLCISTCLGIPLTTPGQPQPPRPAFDSLPLNAGDPKASAWGLWGKDDELGALNLLTPEVIRKAAAEAVDGVTVPLNLALDGFVKPMNPARKPLVHRINPKGYANDDELDMNTQGSSHWDGLRHYPYQDTLQFYNGVTQASITGDQATTKIGVQNIAIKTITGRGVLLDWWSYAQRNNISVEHFAIHAIPLSQLLEVAAEQQVEFRTGDILFVRTGWMPAYHKLSIEQRAALPARAVRASVGVEASGEAIRWHWERAFAAVAGDAMAYEAWPSPKPWGVSMHEAFLSGWGMPIGESFDLEALAAACAERRRWSFFLVSVPLNLPAGVASPPNAVAIF